MCKRCGHDPYLAGKTVIVEFMLNKPITVLEENGYEKVRYVEERSAYMGVCVRHHHDWVTIRTKKSDRHMRAEKVLAIVLDDV